MPLDLPDPARRSSEQGLRRSGHASACDLDRARARPVRRGARWCSASRIRATACASPWSASTPTTPTATRACRRRSSTAASPTTSGVDIVWVSSDRVHRSPEKARELLAGFDGLLVPGGFGVRGVEGMVEAIRAAREMRAPVLRHLPRHAGRDHRVRAPRRAGSTTRHSSEFAPECADPVIALLDSQQRRHRHGRHHAARRLPVPTAARARVPPRSTAADAVSERHRHRYEVVQPLPRHVRRARAAPERPLARRLARGDDRAARASVVRGLPVPPRTPVAPDCDRIRCSADS